MTAPTSAAIRAKLDHPIIDADAHLIESAPILLEYVSRFGDVATYDQAKDLVTNRFGAWYAMARDERLARRQTRGPWWQMPANTLDWATASLPGLFRQRLSELGVDFVVAYPSLGMSFASSSDPKLRRAGARGYNTMIAEMAAEHGSWFCPVASIPTVTPEEAIGELDFAVGELGLKAIVISGNQVRPVPSAAATAKDSSIEVAHYVDFLCGDGPYDYEPFFARCVALGVSVASHGAGIGWSDRRSPTSYVSNHLGMFAAAGFGFCKAIVLSGLLTRLPSLRVAFLEGGVGWARDLHAGLLGHWRLRNRDALIGNLCPANLDLSEMQSLWEKYAPAPARHRFEDIAASPIALSPFRTIDELVRQEEENEGFDEFAAVPAQSAIDSWFEDNFFFGCEAEDKSTAWGFDRRLSPRLSSMLGSDIGHWDVADAKGVIAESYELVEDGLLSEADYRDFTFANAARFYLSSNPEFFKDTTVEDAVRNVALR